MYQIFAHKFQLSKVGVNDIILDGTGEFSLMEAGEMTVSGLKPNEKYSIAAAAFNKTRKMIGKGIGVTSDPILAALPLHLLQCWGYLANAAHSIGCHQIAEKAHLQLESIFVNSKASDSSLLELASHVSCVVSISAEASSSLYTLHEKSVCAEPSACIRGYIQSIQFKNEFGTKAADASMFSDSQGSHPSIGAQLVRLRACLDYLIAAELAERISDPELVVLLLADCYQYLEPLIQLGYPSVFVVNGLMACHQGMLKHSAHLDNDRSQYLARFFIPATYYLTSFMLKLGQLKSLIHISLISLELITKACNVGDLVISNSPNFETQLIGKATKKNASLNPIKKGEISYYSDFNYNAVLATSKDWRKGIPQSHPRGVDLFCEHLETLIAICTGQNALTRSLIIVDQKGSETLKLVLRVNPGLASVFDSGLSGVVNAANAVTTSNFTKEKKTLDANTSLKDFYTIIQTSGAEAVSQQLSSAFSKNPRYLELMTRCAAWAVMHQQFDLAVRICLEISEWIDIRNALVVTGEFVVNKLELKRQILLKRRRKSIFIDKNNMPFHEEDRQTRWVIKRKFSILIYVAHSPLLSYIYVINRSKNKKIKTKGANIQKSSEHQYHHNLDDHSKLDITLRPNEPKTAQSPQPPVQPNHDEEGREGDDVYTREEIEFAGGDNQESGSNSRSGSRGSTRSRSQSADRGKDYNRQHQQQDLHDFEVADQEQSKRTKKKEKSRSKSPKTAKSLTKLNSNNSNAVAIIADRKRHKITQRSLFFNGMSVAEKDMYERHLFVLDNLLSAVWRQSRYRRRIRAIIKIENDWRARMAHVRGFGLLRILEKDVLQSRSRSESTTLGIDSDWFTLGVNGHVHISSQKNSRVLLHEQQQQPAAISSHPAPADTSSNSKNANSKNQANSPTVVIPELLQSFVQSITLSGRAHSWHQVLESSTELLNSLKFISRNQLAVSENWNSHLWRGLFIAGDVLMDMLESIQFRRASHSEIEGFQSNPRVPVISSLDKMPFFGEGASARENTAPGGQYGYFRLGHHAPFSSIEQLKQGLFVGEWVNSQHFQQQMVVDFSWCTEFLTLAVEAMASAKKNHRLLEFSHRFNYIFKDIFSPILYPIIHHSVKKTENSQMKMVDSILKGPSMTASSWYLLMRCRESFSVYLESRLIRSSSVATSSNAEKESKLLQISINSYENAIKSMELAYDQTESPDTKLALAYANNEYGDVLVESGDSMSAAVFWSKASDLMFESYQSIPKHIKLMETSPCNSQEVAFTLIKAAGGAQKSLIAANIVSKMARYSYASNLEKRMQLVRLATALFTSPLYSTLPHPHSEEAFCDYKPPYIMPILEKISFDKFQLNPGSMFEMMLFLSNQWINFTDIPLSAFPLLSMAEYLAEDLCSSSDMKTSVLLLKSEAFAKTKRFSNALSILESVSLGGGLVFKDAQLVFSMNSNSIISDQAPQSAVRPIFYQNDRPLRKEQNMQALKSAHGLTFSEKLKAVMTSSNLIEFEVTKSKVVLLIIESGHVAQDSYFLEKLPLSSSLFNNNYNNSNNNDLPSSDHLNLLSRLSIDASLESNSILSSLAQAVSLKNLETTSSSTNTQKQRPPSSSNQAHSVYESLKNIPASEPLVASGDKSGSSGYANEELDDAQIALRNNEIIQGVFKRIKHTLTQRLSDVKSFVTLSKSFLSGDFSSSEEDSSTIEMKHITTSKKRRYLSSLLQISLILAKISLLRGRNQEAAER